MGGAISDCTPALPGSLFCQPLGMMPTSIKATGLFPAAPDLSRHPAGMLEYVPDPPLWSDGMAKQRFLILPAGTKIDNSDRKRWAFPMVGVAAARSGGVTRVALAGVAPIPWLLKGGLGDATPLPRNAYKVDVAKALVRRAESALNVQASG